MPHLANAARPIFRLDYYPKVTMRKFELGHSTPQIRDRSLEISTAPLKGERTPRPGRREVLLRARGAKRVSSRAYREM